MIMYAASARSIEIRDHDVLHRSVYGELKTSVPTETYQLLTGDDFRETISKDATAFSQQMPFYQPRVLYIAIILGFAKMGINIFLATHLISALAVIAGLWLILVAFGPFVRERFLYSIPLFGVLCGLVDTAKYSTPDGLALLFIIWTVFLLLRGSWRALLLMPLSVLVRPDLLLFAVIVTGFVVLAVPRWRLTALLSLACAVVMLLVVEQYYGHVGLPVIYANTFIGALTRPVDANVVFGWGEYGAALWTGIGEALRNTAFLLFVIVVTLIGAISVRDRGFLDAGARMMRFVAVSSLLYVIIHFAAFPEIEERFFAGQYLLSFVVLAWLLTRQESVYKWETLDP